MPRIYKPVKPSANKAVNPVTETKDSEKKSESQKSNDKKDNEQ